MALGRACGTRRRSTPHLAVVNKVDPLQHVDFDLDLFLPRLERLHPTIERMPVSAGRREGVERLRGWRRFAGPDAASAPVERPAVPSRWLLAAGPGWRRVLIGEVRACTIERHAENAGEAVVGDRPLAGSPFFWARCGSAVIVTATLGFGVWDLISACGVR